MRNLKIAALVAGAFALAMPSIPADAQNRSGGAHKGGGGHAKAGKPTGKAKTSANRGGQQVNRANTANRGGNTANRGGNTVNKGGNKRGGNTVNIDNSKTVVAGNNRPGSSGYYNNGNYYHGGGYYDDDNDFLEFVGKTAAVTAGVSVVAAVIGSTTNDKPDGCQPVNAYGQSYMYCNGTYYQQSGPSSQPTYTVVAPPQ